MSESQCECSCRVESLAQEIDIRDPYAHPKAHELDSMTVEAFIRANSSHEPIFHIFNAAMQACLGCDCSQVRKKRGGTHYHLLYYYTHLSL